MISIVNYARQETFNLRPPVCISSLQESSIRKQCDFRNVLRYIMITRLEHIQE